MNVGDLFDLLEEKLKTGEFSRMDEVDAAGYTVDTIDKANGSTVRIYIEDLPDCSNCFESSDDSQDNSEALDELLDLAENTANMLRGMTLDPAIPQHAKDVMLDRIRELETAVEEHDD